jgi:hypothetical protein
MFKFTVLKGMHRDSMFVVCVNVSSSSSSTTMSPEPALSPDPIPSSSSSYSQLRGAAVALFGVVASAML